MTWLYTNIFGFYNKVPDNLFIALVMCQGYSMDIGEQGHKYVNRIILVKCTCEYVRKAREQYICCVIHPYIQLLGLPKCIALETNVYWASRLISASYLQRPTLKEEKEDLLQYGRNFFVYDLLIFYFSKSCIIDFQPSIPLPPSLENHVFTLIATL